MIPDLFTSQPPIVDQLATHSSELQQDTIEECLPFLNGDEHAGKCNQHGIPRLDKQRHVKFLHKQLGRLPPQMAAADPSRPWFFYWCLAALTLLGEDVSVYRERLVETVRPIQNASGGFGGGFGQDSHLATTYATVLALMLVGGEGAYEVIDRRAMWKWLCSLKQADGGFQLVVGGEEDVRYDDSFLCAPLLTSSPFLLGRTGAEKHKLDYWTDTTDYSLQRCILRISYHFPARDSARAVTRLTCIRRWPQGSFQRPRRVGR